MPRHISAIMIICVLLNRCNDPYIYVTTQDFINFWGNFFAFVLLEMIEISQGFKTFESI
jgi:hypothetical protein